MSRLWGWSAGSVLALLAGVAGGAVAQAPEEQACRGGDAQACFNVGMRHLGNMDNAQNAERSMPFFSKACDGGVAKACYAIGGIHTSAVSIGLDLANDPTSAEQWYQRGCDGGFQPSCERLAQAQNQPAQGRRPTPTEEAACQRGDGDACWTVGLYVAGDASDPAKLAQAAPALEKACAGNVGNACAFLGVMYSSGNGVTQDIGRALSYHTKGCDLGTSLSCQEKGKLSAPIIAAASAPAAAAAAAPQSDAAFEGVRIGMSQSDVRGKLGDPLGRSPSSEGGEIWAYRNRTLGVTFDTRGTVTSLLAIAKGAGRFEGVGVDDKTSKLKELSDRRGWKFEEFGTIVMISTATWTLLVNQTDGKVAMLTWTAN